MNRYPAWKYALIALSVVIAFLYTLPNFYGEAPAVQVSSSKVTVKLDQAEAQKVLKLIDVLEDDDDVQSVWGNYEIPDAVMEKLG